MSNCSFVRYEDIRISDRFYREEGCESEDISEHSDAVQRPQFHKRVSNDRRLIPIGGYLRHSTVQARAHGESKSSR